MTLETLQYLHYAFGDQIDIIIVLLGVVGVCMLSAEVRKWVKK